MGEDVLGLQHATPVAHLLPQLRSAGEYEERKLIRAAIRRVRAQEIEGRCLPSVDSPCPASHTSHYFLMLALPCPSSCHLGWETVQ